MKRAQPTPRWSKEKIIQKLDEAADQLRQGVKDQEQSAADSRAYRRAVGRAIRSGLLDLPEVKAWIAGQRSVNNYAKLRKFKIGLQRGRIGEMDAADLWLNMTAADLYEAGLSFGQVHYELGRLLIAPDFPGSSFINNGKCWLVQGDPALAKLKAAIRRRIRTKQNLYTRLLSHEPDATTGSKRSLARHDHQVEDIVRAQRARQSKTV
jgi:hypothetical protein